MSFIRKNFLAMLIFFTATLALVLVHVLPGAYGGVGKEKYYIKTLDFIFGGATVQVYTEDISASIVLKGGVSIFGVLSIASLLLGVALAIASFYNRTARLEYYGAVLIVVSGISMLLLFNMGTLVTVDKRIIDYRSFIFSHGFNLSIGAIVYGITTIVIGIIGIIIEENNLIR